MEKNRPDNDELRASAPRRTGCYRPRSDPIEDEGGAAIGDSLPEDRSSRITLMEGELRPVRPYRQASSSPARPHPGARSGTGAMAFSCTADRFPEQEMLTMWSSQHHQKVGFAARKPPRPGPPEAPVPPEARRPRRTHRPQHADRPEQPRQRGGLAAGHDHQAAKSGDTIVFAPSLDGQTITLTSDQLAINKSLDIEGPGAGLLAISGNDANRVFDISEGLTVTIAGLTITHGLGTGRSGEQLGGGGGGILNVSSTLTLGNDVLSDNQADSITAAPSAIVRAGPCTVVNSTFTGNQAAGQVGAAFVGEAIWNTVTQIIITLAVGATATVIGCTFTGNRPSAATAAASSRQRRAQRCNGGAIHNDAGTDHLTVENSTFTGNQADRRQRRHRQQGRRSPRRGRCHWRRGANDEVAPCR